LITDAPWILFEPDALRSAFAFYKHLAWDGSVIAMVAPPSIVTLMEHFGDVTTIGVITGTDFFEDPGVHRTLFGDGVAVCAVGFLGGMPVATYSENTALLALSKNANPNIILIAACYAIVLGIFTKFGGILMSIPGPVIGGVSIILFGTVAAVGIKVLIDAKIDLQHQRNMLIVAIILVFGVGFSAGGVQAKIADITISPLAIATVSGVILNLVLPKPKSENGDGEDEKSGKKEDSEGLELPSDGPTAA
jgi:uracil permease